ncbi:TetR/AcrR family transcriptional regulator [Nocardioides plantarum]|uniref:TetR/AcrR family transcriptional regulator n=1 Tax=Nocardioides plantarum TaxID=29299 RepID=A0ABV5KEI3_9ACTN|nr:TetR/AcrR family transcriptional regulator [Nocardioides plantarum]
MVQQDGRQVRWDKHNAERRATILDAALAVIGEGEPGAEFHVQQIAARAGLNRTVVYRHFEDRADLDRAIRAHIADDLTAGLVPEVTLDGTVNQIIRRIIAAYVDWVVAHPAAHAFAAQELSGPFEQGTDRIAHAVTDILELAIALLGAELDDDERSLVDPLAHGLVGAVFGAVRRWVSREPRLPAAPVLVDLLAQSVWNLLDGHARRLGLTIDPDLPLVELLPATTEPTA